VFLATAEAEMAVEREREYLMEEIRDPLQWMDNEDEVCSFEKPTKRSVDRNVLPFRLGTVDYEQMTG
jgi:hypothetical protein